MSFNLNLKIDFLKDEASVYLNGNFSSEDNKFAHLLIFTNYLCRNLITLDKKETVLREILYDIGSEKKDLKEIINERGIEIPKLVGYNNKSGNKTFSAKLKYYGKDKIDDFQMNTKGFGFFSRGVEKYSLISVILLMQYLLDKFSDDNVFMDKITEICKICLGAHRVGDLTPQTEGIIVKAITNEIGKV